MEKLYRGVCVDADEFNNLALGDKDIALNYEPIINENGEKTVKDGNEYGVYMSDNKNMVEDAYGKVHAFGEAVSTVKYKDNGRPMSVTKPRVSVVYEINPENLPNLRKPKITSVLEGHYNNGYGGDEWICDYVPKENYSVARICIGYDSLFESVTIDVQGKSPKDIKSLVEAEVGKREKNLKEFAGILEALPDLKRSNLKVGAFKYLLGHENVAHLDVKNFNPKTEDDKIKFLMATEYQNNGYNPAVDYLFDMKKRMETAKSNASLNDVLNGLLVEINSRLDNNQFPNEKVETSFKARKAMIEGFLVKLKSIQEPEFTENGLGE